MQQEALKADYQAEEVLGAATAQTPRTGLRDAALATVAAWEAQSDLEAALEALKANPGRPQHRSRPWRPTQAA